MWVELVVVASVMDSHGMENVMHMKMCVHNIDKSYEYPQRMWKIGEESSSSWT